MLYEVITDGDHVHVAWLRGGVLEYVASDNAGLSFASLPVELSDATAGAVTAAALVGGINENDGRIDGDAGEGDDASYNFV